MSDFHEHETRLQRMHEELDGIKEATRKLNESTQRLNEATRRYRDAQLQRELTLIQQTFECPACGFMTGDEFDE